MKGKGYQPSSRMGAGGGDGSGGAQDVDQRQVANALVVVRRLSRVLIAFGGDIKMFDVSTGAPLGGCNEVCEESISCLVLDQTERTAFAGSLGGELSQLLLTSTAVQPYRKPNVAKAHGKHELTCLANMAEWGAAGSKMANGVKRNPEIDRHGSLVLSLAVNGSVAITSVCS